MAKRMKTVETPAKFFNPIRPMSQQCRDNIEASRIANWTPRQLIFNNNFYLFLFDPALPLEPISIRVGWIAVERTASLPVFLLTPILLA
jgi:hypothetical protein